MNRISLHVHLLESFIQIESTTPAPYRLVHIIRGLKASKDGGGDGFEGTFGMKGHLTFFQKCWRGTAIIQNAI
jgi:hypothetical protein